MSRQKSAATRESMISSVGQQEHKEITKAEEIWSKVLEIVDGGVLSLVETKQTEAREFLVETEARLQEVISGFNAEYQSEPVTIPDTAATLPGGTLSLELQRAIPAINIITDKQLKFRLTTFIDDYRRILTQNREVEKTQVAAELEEHFKEGSCGFVDYPEETEEMISGMEAMEEETMKMARLKKEVMQQIESLKMERDKVQAQIPVMPESIKPWKEAVLAITEIINKPHVKAAMGHDDWANITFNIDIIKYEANRANERKRSSTSGRRVSPPKIRRNSSIRLDGPSLSSDSNVKKSTTADRESISERRSVRGSLKTRKNRHGSRQHKQSELWHLGNEPLMGKIQGVSK